MIADLTLAHLAAEWWWPLRQCRGADAEMFTSPRLADTAIAVYCQPCEVRLECLGRAMDRAEQRGVAGGLTMQDRARLYVIFESAGTGGYRS